jgi:hypothetical protein
MTTIPAAWSRSRAGALELLAHNPSLYQINTRVWLHELGQALGRPARLDDVPDESLDRIASDGFDWIWLLGVWQTGEAGRDVSRRQPEWQREYHELLPDGTTDDICGSPFAVKEYVVNGDFGGPRALEDFRERLAGRGVRLMLDFVPNHTALDHAWAHDHPEFYVRGDDVALSREPQNYRRVATRSGPRILAHGRDPYFPGWPDTLQLNYRDPRLRDAMLEVLDDISGQCDGLRCDMAMLVLPDVIARTWGELARPLDGATPVDDPFWPMAIARVRMRHPGFVFMAEAYWDLEWTLQQQGFDYTYDKTLYDRLRTHNAGSVRGHLHAELPFQQHSARFLENHDEPRAAAAFPPMVHRAAAVVTYLIPGLRFVHEGQRSGRSIRASNHLRRRVPERVDQDLMDFYARLLACAHRAEARVGEWCLLDPHPAWESNPTWDHFIAFSWESAEGRLLGAVNYGPTQAQCYLSLPWPDLDGRSIDLRDLMAEAAPEAVHYERDGTDLLRRGLYLDMPAWGHHVFEVTSRPG